MPGVLESFGEIDAERCLDRGMQFGVLCQVRLQCGLWPANISGRLKRDDVGRRGLIRDEANTADKLTGFKILKLPSVFFDARPSRMDKHKLIQSAAMGDETFTGFGLLPSAELEQINHFPRRDGSEHKPA